jgi:hypothetical protein
LGLLDPDEPPSSPPKVYVVADPQPPVEPTTTSRVTDAAVLMVLAIQPMAIPSSQKDTRPVTHKLVGCSSLASK